MHKSVLFIAFAVITVTHATNEEGKKFLDENKSKEGVITTASGLQMKVHIYT